MEWAGSHSLTIYHAAAREDRPQPASSKCLHLAGNGDVISVCLMLQVRNSAVCTRAGWGAYPGTLTLGNWLISHMVSPSALEKKLDTYTKVTTGG
jgi:hypothetical protein